MADQNPNQSGPPCQSGLNFGGQNVTRTQQASGFHLGPQAASQNAQSNLEGSRQQSSEGLGQQQAVPPAESIPYDQLLAYSKLIGREWERMAYRLGFTQHQVDCLKDRYPDKPETRFHTMVKKWHDTVVSCGQDARQLLAACFASEGNNEAAEQVIGPGRLAGLRGGTGIKAAPATEQAIQQISFDLGANMMPGITGSTAPPTSRVNVRGPRAINLFGGSEMRLSQGVLMSISSSSISSDSSSGATNIPYPSDIVQGEEVNYGRQNAINVFSSNIVTEPMSRLVIGEAPQRQVIEATQQLVPGYEPVRGEKTDVTDSAVKPKQSSNSTSHELKKEICDILSQSQVNGLNESMKSVCALVRPDFGGYGTAFRVGDKLLITAYHVIRDLVKAGYCLSKHAYATFNEKFIDRPDSIKTYTLADAFEFDEILDIAFLKITNPDDHLPRPLNLSLEENIVSHFSLIGYDHPESPVTKHLDPGCPVIPQTSPVIQQAQSWLNEKSQELKKWYISAHKDPSVVDSGFCGHDSSHNMIINCYSEKGASGGPLMDYRNPNSMAVVGVLTHGLPICFWDLPKHIQGIFPKHYRLEVATRMCCIREFVFSKDTYLAMQLFP